MTNGTLPPKSRPVWENWSKNITHQPPPDGFDYYFAPKSLNELRVVVQQAVADKAVLRVSGQRHSQTPLVIGADARPTRNYLVDLSCYADLGPHGDQNMVLDIPNKKITVNTGVREDDVDAVLTKNNLMLRTVTAGGFFSLGGMTAVDVHGATTKAPIFASTVSAFTILQADGTVVTIDENTSPVNGWKPIQFARVNLGGLGIVTSVTIDVMDRPWATTLKGGQDSFDATSQVDFCSAFQKLLNQHDRVETFYNPYFLWPVTNEYLAIWWDVASNPSNKIPNNAGPGPDACVLASEDKYGAPLLSQEWIAEQVAIAAQKSKLLAGSLVVGAMYTVANSATTADNNHSDMWLTEATRVMFMSYFIELPNIDANGLGKVWDGLQVVGKRMRQGSPFYIAAPMEFRFVTGSDVAMAGIYTTNLGSVFVNLDLIGFVEATPSSQYPAELLQFFADVEREWMAMGGLPHNGKMYGFYDPKGPPNNHTPAFNKNFLDALRTRRGAPLVAFRDFRKIQDPNGLFYNDFLRAVLEG